MDQPPEQAASPLPAPRSRRRLLVAALVAALAGAAAWGVHLWLRQPRAQTLPVPPDPRLTYDGPFRNVRPGVEYVGNGACAVCHQSECEKFHQHPMSRSITAVSSKSGPAQPEPGEPFEKLNVRFRVERERSRLWHSQEYIAPGGEQLAKVRNEVQFIIGSGQRGHSYFTTRDGFLFQTPISWYSQKQVWDLSPGFQDAAPRPIASDCLFCHAGGARPVAQSTNRYEEGIFTSLGISCERCHGPAELHVRHQEQGRHVKGEPDYTIVNPRRLPRPLREDVCHQCHLAGEARAPRRGRDVFDYRPGLPLHEFWAVFVPAPGVRSGQKAVGQVEQFTASKCFTASDGGMGCTTCHDPHERLPPEKRTAHYRQVCLGCHQEKHPCSLDRPTRLIRNKEDSCVACHMTRLTSTDIAHTAMTDHRIQLTPNAEDKPEAETGSTLLPRQPVRLFHQDRRGEDEDSDRDRALGLAIAALKKPEVFSRALPLAVAQLEKARDRRPGDVALLLTLGQALFRLQRTDDSLEVFLRVLDVEPRNGQALAHAGYAFWNQGSYDRALSYLDRAAAEEPWNDQSHKFLALSRIKKQQFAQAAGVCAQWLEYHPGSAEARLLLAHCLDRQGKPAEAAVILKKAEAMMTPRDREFRAWFSKQFE